MQFTVILPVLACVAATVHATPYLETNAARLARGLPPNPPVRRTGTGRSTFKRHACPILVHVILSGPEWQALQRPYPM